MLKTKSILFLLVAAIILGLALTQLVVLSADMIWGNHAAEKLLVSPRHGLLRIPKYDFTIRHQAVNRLAADFAQVYFPSVDFLPLNKANNYLHTPDPWNRPSRYPPFVHYISYLVFNPLPYGYASFAHMLVQIVLFFCGLRVAFAALGLRYWFFPSLLLIGICLFLTPVGLSWFERGQFSLYVALSYLWLFLGLITNKKRYLLFSAVCAFVKWTSFPFSFVVFAVYFMQCRDRRELKNCVAMSVVFGGTVLLLFFVNFPAGICFIRGLISQEGFSAPQGISLTRLLPHVVVKFLPLLLILLAFLRSQISFSMKPKLLLENPGQRFSHFIPFLTAAAILFVVYPTVAFDYSVPCLFGLIPFIIYWAKLPGLNVSYQRLVIFLFFSFIVTASFSIEIFQSYRGTTFAYLCVAGAIIFMDFLVTARCIPRENRPAVRFSK